MKHYSINFEILVKASRAMYDKAQELRRIGPNESGRYKLPSNLTPTDIAAFLDEMRDLIDSADPDTMLVEDEEGYLIRTTDQEFEQ